MGKTTNECPLSPTEQQTLSADKEKQSGGIHDDHRSRVRRRALREGLRSFEPHEILELLLFYAIPRKDTNPIGHRLLERYKTLAGVFDADYHDLASQEGLGETSAILLKLVPELARMYLLSRDCGSTYFDSIEEVGHYLVNYYIGVQNEMPVVLLFNNKREMVHLEILGEGVINNAAVHPRRIVELAISYKASAVVLAHNHPGGEMQPSDSDVAMTKTLRRTLQELEIELIDHIVVGRSGYTGILYASQGMGEF